jgi:hypothetical protein
MEKMKPFIIGAAAGAVGMVVLSKVGMKGAKGLNMTSALLLGAVTGAIVAGGNMVAPKLMK